jgi:hypothetical protein
LDQEGVPTLVEVKRSTDTRIRREVVGQMLDYAANAVVRWPAEAIRASFEANCAAAGRDPEEAIRTLVEAEDVDAFWEQVGTNLERGRIRMVFVADRIPSELRRIVEFLNEQMSPAEVVAVEVKQYLDESSGHTGLVPRVVGHTLAAERKKVPRRESRVWDESSVFERIAERFGDEQCRAARGIYDWGKAHVSSIRWGSGSQDGSFILDETTPGGPCPFLAVYTSGHVELRFGALKEHERFRAEDARSEIVTRLNEVPGVNLSRDAHQKRPSMNLVAFTEPSARNALIAVLADVLAGLHDDGER